MFGRRLVYLISIAALFPIAEARAGYGLLPPASASKVVKASQPRPLPRAASGWKRQVGSLAPYKAATTKVVATKTGRVVSYPPNRLTMEGLLARRALNPKRFDYYHPYLSRFLVRAEQFRATGPICGIEPIGIISDTPYHRYLLWRRSLNPNRFDFYHPLLGVILQEHARIVDAGKVCPPKPPTPPIKPKPPSPPGGNGDSGKPDGGGGTVTPQQVVPEPSSVALLAAGMGVALVFGLRRRGRLSA